jgi:hypothetical protein
MVSDTIDPVGGWNLQCAGATVRSRRRHCVERAQHLHDQTGRTAVRQQSGSGRDHDHTGNEPILDRRHSIGAVGYGPVAGQRGDDLIVGDGPFTFGTRVAAGGSCNVTVESGPGGQVCTVSDGAGTVGSANVTSVDITCASEDDFNRPNGDLGLGSAKEGLRSAA